MAIQLADASLHTITLPIASCYFAKLYYAGYRRGVGGDTPEEFTGTSLFVESDVDSLFITLKEIEAYIKPRKKQGRYWQVYDVPSVVIETKNKSFPKLVIAGGGFNIDPLDDFRPQLPPTIKFGYLARALMSQLPKYVYALQTNRNIPVATFPFVCKRSMSEESKRIMRELGEGPVPSKGIQWDDNGKWGWPKSAINLVCKINLWLAD